MKKKILIALMALLLPAFLIVNSLADESKDDNEEITINNDIMVDSPLFTSKETYAKYEQPASSLIMDNFKLVISNSNFELYTSDDTGAIRVKNLKTGYIWASDITNVEEFGFNKKSIREVSSAFQLSYRDDKLKNDSIYSADTDIDLSYKVNGNELKYSVEFDDEEIYFNYYITLTDEGINLKLPHESIEEEGGSKITSISFFPYMGAAFGNSVPGYMFIPSGNGGLIRFENNPSIIASYSQTYYGTDVNRNKNTEKSVLSIPVYGVTHGVEQNAMFTRIKSGSEYATLTYEPSSIGQVTNKVTGVTNGFHKIFNKFAYREAYSITVTGEPIQMLAEEIYPVDIEMSYSFLSNEDADYIGMAKSYQEDLKEEGVIKENAYSGSGNVHIDVLGGETESGIVFDKFVKMTTTKQLVKINNELTHHYDTKFIYTLRGFNNGGYSKQLYDNYKFDSRLGNLNDLNGLDYYMYYNPVESYADSLSYPNKVLVNIYNEKNYITVEQDSKYKFYASVDAVLSGVKGASAKYEDSVAYDGLGYRLYGDENSEYTRSQTKDLFVNSIEGTVPMFKPNEYFLGNTSQYLNMSLYHDRLRFITDSVPFLQIALRGYVDYYSTYLNFSTNQDVDLLKCIEYGSNISYLISYEESYKVSNTLSSHLYATHYESNKDKMFEQINDITLALRNIQSQEIVDRIVVESGIVQVIYGNGLSIYVNYTDTDYTIPGTNKVVRSMYFKEV